MSYNVQYTMLLEHDCKPGELILSANAKSNHIKKKQGLNSRIKTASLLTLPLTFYQIQ